jgi:hypothetical protein
LNEGNYKPKIPGVNNDAIDKLMGTGKYYKQSAKDAEWFKDKKVGIWTRFKNLIRKTK